MRRRRPNSLLVPVVLVVVAVTYPKEAHAYLDASTVNMLLQAAAAALAGSLFLLRQHWRRFKALFARPAPANEANDADEGTSPTTPDAEDSE